MRSALRILLTPILGAVLFVLMAAAIFSPARRRRVPGRDLFGGLRGGGLAAGRAGRCVARKERRTIQEEDSTWKPRVCRHCHNDPNPILTGGTCAVCGGFNP